MKRLILQALAGFALAGLGLGANAQDTTPIPDLKGRWSGIAEGIVAGTTPHHAGTSGLDQPRLTRDTFTITIEGQEGRRFWGILASERARGSIVGVIGSDGRTIRMQGVRGTTDGLMLDRDTVELVYGHSTDRSLVAATNLMKREK